LDRFGETIWQQCTRNASQYLTANFFDRLDQLSGDLRGFGKTHRREWRDVRGKPRR
jgi:hypothetical protein